MDEIAGLGEIFDDDYHLITSLSSSDISLMTWHQLILATAHTLTCGECKERLGDALFKRRWLGCLEPDSGSEPSDPEGGSSS